MMAASSSSGSGDIPHGDGADAAHRTHVSFAGKNLTREPELERYLALESLDLSRNELAFLSAATFRSTRLRALVAKLNRIASLPESLGTLPAAASLAELVLPNNDLQSLPESIGLLVRLVNLDLSCNRLSQLPASFGELSSLQRLSLRDNRFTGAMSGTLSTLRQLQYLDVSSNAISALPSLAAATQLKRLTISHTLLDAAAIMAAQLVGASTSIVQQQAADSDDDPTRSDFKRTHLSLAGKGLNNEPDLKPYGSLETLDLSHNALENISPAPFRIATLRVLVLKLNLIQYLPDDIGLLPAAASLTELVLSNNNLQSLPESFALLVHLVNLDLSCNRLSHLPSGFAGLTNLQRLSLKDNQFIGALGDAIATLHHMQYLDVSSNAISALPSLAAATRLKRLTISRTLLDAAAVASLVPPGASVVNDLSDEKLEIGRAHA